MAVAPNRLREVLACARAAFELAVGYDMDVFSPPPLTYQRALLYVLGVEATGAPPRQKEIVVGPLFDVLVRVADAIPKSNALG